MSLQMKTKILRNDNFKTFLNILNNKEKISDNTIKISDAFSPGNIYVLNGLKYLILFQNNYN